MSVIEKNSKPLRKLMVDFSFRFPEARAMKRKFVFHAGPTNSGKTHKALERFQKVKSGIYCGPLRLLASEVYQKTNDNVR